MDGVSAIFSPCRSDRYDMIAELYFPTKMCTIHFIIQLLLRSKKINIFPNTNLLKEARRKARREEKENEMMLCYILLINIHFEEAKVCIKNPSETHE